MGLLNLDATRRLPVPMVSADNRVGSPAAAGPPDPVAMLVGRLFLGVSSGTELQVVTVYQVEAEPRIPLCEHMATTLASLSSGRVCLVLADARSPVPPRQGYIALAPPPLSFAGLAHQLPGSVRKLGSNLWSLSIAPGDRRPRHFWLDPAQADHCARLLRKSFSYVVIDAGSVWHDAEALVLGRIADGVVMVVVADSTRRQTACDARDLVQGAGINLLGVVMAGRAFPISAGD